MIVKCLQSCRKDVNLSIQLTWTADPIFFKCVYFNLLQNTYVKRTGGGEGLKLHGHGFLHNSNVSSVT